MVETKVYYSKPAATIKLSLECLLEKTNNIMNEFVRDGYRIISQSTIETRLGGFTVIIVIEKITRGINTIMTLSNAKALTVSYNR